MTASKTSWVASRACFRTFRDSRAAPSMSLRLSSWSRPCSHRTPKPDSPKPSSKRLSAEGDPLQLFYTGLLKPLIGIVAGLFAYAAVSTGLVTIQVPGQAASPQVFYMAIAFLAGFSERFAKDLTEASAHIEKKEQAR